MNLQLGSFIILAIVFVTVGFIGGALIALFFADREKGGEQPVEAVKRENVREQEIAILLRDPESGSLIMELQGQSFSASKDLPDKTRVALLKVAQEWFIWLGGRIESPKSSAIQTAQTAQEKQDDVVVSDRHPAVSARQVVKKAGPGKLQETLQKTVAPAEVTVGVEIPAKASSIVEQIDEILQEMLYQSSLSNRKIRLAEDLKSGVIVWVDQKSFMGIDTVDEPEVITIIRQAVTEWERRAELRHR